MALAGISVACAIYGTQAREVSLQHSTASLTQVFLHFTKLTLIVYNNNKGFIIPCIPLYTSMQICMI